MMTKYCPERAFGNSVSDTKPNIQAKNNAMQAEPKSKRQKVTPASQQSRVSKNKQGGPTCEYSDIAIDHESCLL